MCSPCGAPPGDAGRPPRSAWTSMAPSRADGKTRRVKVQLHPARRCRRARPVVGSGDRAGRHADSGMTRRFSHPAAKARAFRGSQAYEVVPSDRPAQGLRRRPRRQVACTSEEVADLRSCDRDNAAHLPGAYLPGSSGSGRHREVLSQVTARVGRDALVEAAVEMERTHWGRRRRAPLRPRPTRGHHRPGKLTGRRLNARGHPVSPRPATLCVMTPSS
jgi:hypothetical protein